MEYLSRGDLLGLLKVTRVELRVDIQVAERVRGLLRVHYFNYN